uniref:WD repeat-containing protein 73 n=1 Tax=Amazona collaria TaxID=241587 RepID=A0A8B9G8E8_9PSIT
MALTVSLCCTRPQGVFVAGYGQSGGNEILQLLPPPPMREVVTKSLFPEREFKVECGGFSSRPIYSLKCVPGHIGDAEVAHPLGENVIKPVSAIPAENGHPWARIATTAARAQWVLHGSTLDSVHITEVEARKNISILLSFPAARSSEELSGLAFLDCNTLLLCCAKGQLYLGDIRQPQAPLDPVSVPWALGDERWCMGVRQAAAGSASSSQPIACLSNRGHLTLTDVRKPSEPLASVKCSVPSPSSNAEFLCVSWAPALEGCVAISGFDGTVHVYDTRSWDSSASAAEPTFVHKGHMFGEEDSNGDPPLVTAHTWHPQKPRTLLSAASDGSLSIWDWVQPRGTCG